MSQTPRLRFCPVQYFLCSCDYSHKSYDLCSTNGVALLDPVASALFLTHPPNSTRPNFIGKTLTYPRKSYKRALSTVVYSPFSSST
ncbi:hypothetical protein SADUNF_Sadunf10G0122400 [Salix dunnii]|uniref:Uncharacterized protein n=1 Tax=Salix dunnii TaxID=1413687 RepID=A0A835MUX9_9ROSI|nr:hypothetical protein SADUNF_Sadunf10G0122400 [Salix dunnii]